MLDQQALIEATQELEPLPPTVHQLAAIASRRDWNAMEAEETIALDPVLMEKLLGLANSVASGSWVEIVSIRDAVVRMGIGAALALVTATAVSARTRLALPQYRLAEGELWRHSVSTSIAAQMLPAYCSVAIPPESFTAALLQGATRQGWSKGSDDAVIHETSFVVQRVRNPSGEGSARPHR